MKKKSVLGWVVALIVVLLVLVTWNAGLFGGSSLNSNTPATTVTTSTGTTSVTHTLDGTTFRFTSYDNHIIPANENYIMTFSGGSLHGGICDNFSGPYTASNGLISAKLLSSTKGCTLPTDINAADQLFHTTISQSSKYTYIGSVLTISGSGHTLTFNAWLK